MKYQVMPDLTPIEYEALKADIAEKGVLIPVEMDESGELLDGHHRRRAWEELKADGVSLPDYPRIIRTGMTEQEKRNHARRLNVLRRQLTKEQRDEQMRAMRADGMTYQQIAEELGVDTATAWRKTNDVNLHLQIENERGQTRPATYAKRETVEEYFGETDDAARPSCVTVIDEWGSEETIRIEPDEEIGVVKTPHVARNSGNNEWYTPEPFIIAARAVMGGIDCDPATSEEANTTVGASTIYTAETDGLSHNWRGRVWLNPPYAAPLISQFCEKLSLEFQSGRVTEGIVLVNNATETGWFATLIDCASAIVFPQTRVRFWQPSGEIGAPLQGQAILYFGGKPKTFLSEFKTFGWGAYL